MARTREGAALTAQHRSSQLALRASLLRDLLTLWPVFVPTDFSTFDAFATAASVLIAARRRDSAGLASRYFLAFRAAEGIAGRADSAVVEGPGRDEIRETLRMVGLAGVANARRAGQSVQRAADNGLVRVSGAATRLALDGGRETLIRSIERDPARPRWHRVTSVDPCSFCRMLASRGAVYRAEETARFDAHDHCSCVPEPAYEGSSLPPATQRFREQWDQATRGHAGQEALVAFRRAVEGRD